MIAAEDHIQGIAPLPGHRRPGAAQAAFRRTDMDHSANQTPGKANRDGQRSIGGNGTPYLQGAVAPRMVEHHHRRDGTSLHQSIELRRHDGSTWTAYSRQLLLPTDDIAAELTTRQANCVLDLLAQALAAAESARHARGVMLEWAPPTPPWFARYG